LPGGTDEDHRESQDLKYLGRDSNRALPKYESSGALPLDRRVRFEEVTVGREHKISVTHILVKRIPMEIIEVARGWDIAEGRIHV
jgi:hypothetical protein